MRRAEGENGGGPSGIRRAVALGRAHPAAAFSVGFGLLVAVLFFDPLFFHREFTGRDLVSFFYPIEKAVHDGWRSGHVPLILPELSWGKPLAANPNAGVFYPPRIAMAALPFPIAIKIFIVLHVWIAGLGAWMLARFLGVSSAGAAIAGIVFALCGPTISDAAYPNILPGLAAIPFLILAAGALARAPGRRRAALFAIAWGTMLLIGDVFTAGLALAGGALLTIQESGAKRIPALCRLAAATIPGFLLASIQGIPALLLIPHTVRALHRFPFRTVLTWSLSPWRLLELLVRFPFGNVARSGAIWGDALWYGKSAGFFNTMYVGVFGTIAVLAARPPRGRRIFPYGLALLALFVAVAGWYFPVTWLDRASPIPLRYPEKFMVGFTISAAILSGILWDKLASGAAREVLRCAILIGTGVLGIAALARVFPEPVRELVLGRWTRYPANAGVAATMLPGIWLRASLFWFALSAILLLLGRASWRRTAVAILGTFIVFDLTLNRVLFVRTADVGKTLEAPASADVVRRLNRGELLGYVPIEDYYLRSFDRDDLLLDSGAPFGVFYVFNQDYDASDLYRVDVARAQTYRDAGRWSGLPGFLSAFSAHTAIVGAGRMPNGFSREGFRMDGRSIVVNDGAVPGIRLAPAIEEVGSVSEAYDALRDDRRDLVRVPVVETGRRAIRRLSTGALRILLWSPNRIEIETRTPGEARLIFPRAYFPYREIEVDGRSTSAEATNFCLTSVSVPGGVHRVTVQEELPGRSAGPILSLAGAVTILLLAVPARH